jgi:hypothetical protein
LPKEGKRRNGKKTSGNRNHRFSKVNENDKPTFSKSSSSSKNKKLEENQSNAHHNQSLKSL